MARSKDDASGTDVQAELDSLREAGSAGAKLGRLECAADGARNRQGVRSTGVHEAGSSAWPSCLPQHVCVRRDGSRAC